MQQTSAPLAQQPSSQLYQPPQRPLPSEQSTHQHINSSHQPTYPIHLQTPHPQLPSLPSLPLFAPSHSSLPLIPSVARPAAEYSLPPSLAVQSSAPHPQQHFPVSSFPQPPTFSEQRTADAPDSVVVAHLQQLRLLSQHLSLEQLVSLGVDQQTILTLIALNATQPLPSSLPLPSSSSSSSPPSSVSSSSPTSSSVPGMSYKSEYSKRHRDGDSSTLHKRKVDSHATTPSSASDNLSPSPRRRRVMDRSGDDDDRASDSGSDNDSDGTNSSETADDSPLPSSNKKRTEEEKVRNELQRKRQHQKSDKQRRAKIKDGMEQLKALVSLHGKLESPDQASIVSASVDLVHALRQEISGLKAEVERTRGENAAMKQRGLAGYAGLDAVMRGQLGALGQSPLGQLQLSQLSSLQALNSQLSSLNQQNSNTAAGNVSQQQLSGLNTLNNINMLSSLGLPTNINAAQYQPAPNSHHHNPHNNQQQSTQQQPHQGIHSPLPLMPMQSPPPLSMPASHGSNGFTSQFLTHSPPANGMMYGKEWQ